MADGAGFDWKKALWIVLALGSVMVQGPKFVAALRPPPTYIVDFAQEWSSARNYWHGRPIYEKQEDALLRHLGFQRQPQWPGRAHLLAQIYGAQGAAPLGAPLGPMTDVVVAWQVGDLDALKPPKSRVFNEYNAHPPTSVLLALPFAFLSYSDAFLVWSLLSLAALAVSLGLIVRQLGIELSPWSIFPAITLLLWCNPLSQQTNQGQLNLFLLLLIVGAWAADRTSRPAWAGALLGAAAAIKLFPALLFLLFLLRKEWRVLVVGMVSFAVLSGITAGLFGVQAYRDYATVVVPHVAEYRSSWLNFSIAGFWSKLFDQGAKGVNVVPLWQNPALARAGTLVCSAAVLVLLGWAVRRAPGQRDLGFASTVTAMLLVSPITWDHYLVLLFLPLAILWVQLPRVGMARLLLWIAAAVCWLFPSFFWYLFMRVDPRTKAWLTRVATPGEAITTLSIQFYALLVLFGLVLYAAWKAPVKGVPEGRL